MFRRFKYEISNGSNLDRDFLVNFWVLDREMVKEIERRKRRNSIYRNNKDDMGLGRYVFD